MYDMDPDQERLAGCYDGMKAGKPLTISEVRLELVRWGLAIDKDLQIKEAVGRISLRPEPEPKPDNPLALPNLRARGILAATVHAPPPRWAFLKRRHGLPPRPSNTPNFPIRARPGWE